MTPSAYLMDECWVELTDNFCNWIRQTEVVCQYPELQMAFFDGFGSHFALGGGSIDHICKAQNFAGKRGREYIISVSRLQS